MRRSTAATLKAGRTRAASRRKLSMLQNNVLLPRGAQVELVILEAKEKSGDQREPVFNSACGALLSSGDTYLVVSEERKETSDWGRIVEPPKPSVEERHWAR